MLYRFRNYCVIKFPIRHSGLAPKKASGATQRARMESLDERRMLAVSGGAVGINVNDGSTAFMNKAVPVMKSLGVTTVRLWYTSDFNSRKIDGTLQRAIDYSNKGFDVMLIVQTKNGAVTNPSKVKSWFQWAAGNSSLKNAVDRWEIGNEPDHKQYWNGSLKSYVTNFLKPAYEALHAKGEKVVSAGPSWDANDVAEMISHGMLKYCDFVGYHPYANGVSLVKTRVSQINKVVAGRKPIIASEWNVRGFEKGSTSQWAQAIKDAYSTIKGGFAYNYYFALKKVNTMAGPAGILMSNGSKNSVFYNAFATFKGTAGSTSSSGSSSGNTPSSNGNSSSNSSTATIAGSLWNDSNGDGKWDARETATGSRVVYIDANGNGKLDKGEKTTTADSKGVFKFTGLKAGTYKIGRVFPKGYKLSNGAHNYVTASVVTGQYKTGVNLGSRYA